MLKTQIIEFTIDRVKITIELDISEAGAQIPYKLKTEALQPKIGFSYGPLPIDFKDM